MGVALEHFPVLVPGDGGDLRNVPIGLEQAADAFMAEIVEVQVLDAEVTADAAEGGADGAAVVGKDEAGRAAKSSRLLKDDGDGVIASVGDEGIT